MPGRPGSWWSSTGGGPRAVPSALRASPRSSAGWASATGSGRRGRDTRCMRSDAIRRVIAAYDDPVVRAYCWARFWILRQRFLDEIGQYLPPAGPVLDIGCGFGLFSLYYAAVEPGRFLRGIDRSARRIALARRAAARLGVG